MATFFSSFWPSTLTVTLPDFSSTLTTVASVAAPLIVILTLSPALTCALVDALGSGETGAGVDAAGLALLFAFELLSVPAGSQAAIVSDRINTTKSFFVMIVLRCLNAPARGAPVSLLRWVNGNKGQNISCPENFFLRLSLGYFFSALKSYVR